MICIVKLLLAKTAYFFVAFVVTLNLSVLTLIASAKTQNIKKCRDTMLVSLYQMRRKHRVSTNNNWKGQNTVLSLNKTF